MEDTPATYWRHCFVALPALFHFCADLDFRFRDPEAGFERSKVKGVVAKLVRVKDTSNATALEVAAGGKLYQIVVDTEATAKALLAKGHLRNRVTIIPINKASKFPLAATVTCPTAKGNIVPSLST